MNIHIHMYIHMIPYQTIIITIHTEGFSYWVALHYYSHPSLLATTRFTSGQRTPRPTFSLLSLYLSRSFILTSKVIYGCTNAVSLIGYRPPFKGFGLLLRQPWIPTEKTSIV
jgi:hypothetical protein